MIRGSLQSISIERSTRVLYTFTGVYLALAALALSATMIALNMVFWFAKPVHSVIVAGLFGILATVILFTGAYFEKRWTCTLIRAKLISGPFGYTDVTLVRASNHEYDFEARTRSGNIVRIMVHQEEYHDHVVSGGKRTDAYYFGIAV